jgi:hypothetical protein
MVWGRIGWERDVMGNYIIDTTVDPVTGKTTVSVTTYGLQGQTYQNKWVSGQPPAAFAPASTAITAPSVNLSAPDVLNEAVVAGNQLVVAVAAGTQSPGVVLQPNPDPSEA